MKMLRSLIILMILITPNLLYSSDNDQWKLVKLYSNYFNIQDDWDISIDMDSKGNIWIGSLRDICPAILTKFDGTTSESYTKDEYEDVSNHITCLDIDQNDNIWFGTYDSGVYKFDGKDFINIDTNNTPYLSSEAATRL